MKKSVLYLLYLLVILTYLASLTSCGNDKSKKEETVPPKEKVKYSSDSDESVYISGEFIKRNKTYLDSTDEETHIEFEWKIKNPFNAEGQGELTKFTTDLPLSYITLQEGPQTRYTVEFWFADSSKMNEWKKYLFLDAKPDNGFLEEVKISAPWEMWK